MDITFQWEDNIKMGLREIEWGDIDWVGLADDGDQCRVLIEDDNALSGFIKCLEILEQLHNW
jgi:hypothetical protein